MLDPPPCLMTLISMPRQAAAKLEALSRFSRQVTTARTTSEILSLLADAAVELVGAKAAAVFEFRETGTLHLIGQRGLPSSVRWVDAEVDDVHSATERLVAACQGQLSHTRTMPLMSAGDLFGSLVLLEQQHRKLSEIEEELLEVLVNMSAAVVAHTVRFSALARSYTELRASREVLARSHKLRALGQMAAGISHDLKNILNPISLYLQVLKRAVPKGDTATIDDAIVQMQGTIRRGVEIIDRLREFSRQTPVRRLGLVDLNQLALEAIELSKPRLASNSRATFDLSAALGAPPPVKVQPSELVSALVNLIVNAIDAMPSGGKITVATGEDRTGGWVSVEDDGPGMPPEIERKIFEPFFTTKGSEGTGLGLAMVYAFVQRHNGEISLRTAPGQGACFKMWFPSADEPESVASPESVTSSARG